MTVQNTNRKDVYLTNGTTIYWPYTFEIFTTDGSDLALYETNLTTGETVLIDTNLTRDIINSRIKYPRTGSPRPEGYKITVARITERTQGIDLETQSFDPKNMERGLDKLTAMVQEIDETVSRAAVADISQQGVNFTFPSPVGGKVVGWNAEGTGLINLDNTTLGIEAQMLAATEAAQTAADKVDNLVGAFEADGTTVKEATHAASASGDMRFQINGAPEGNTVIGVGEILALMSLRVIIPAGKSLKIKRVRFYLPSINSNLKLRIGIFAGASWLSSGYQGDSALNETLFNNSTGSNQEKTLQVFASNSGLSDTLSLGSGWWVDLAIEDV